MGRTNEVTAYIESDNFIFPNHLLAFASKLMPPLIPQPPTIDELSNSLLYY